MRISKKIIAGCCVLSMLVSNAMVVQAESISQDYFVYQDVSEDSVALVAYSGPQVEMQKALSIPAYYNDKKVVSIGNNLFNNNYEALKGETSVFAEVTIESADKVSLGEALFQSAKIYGKESEDCTGNVVINGNVSSIGTNAFNNTEVYGTIFDCKGTVDRFEPFAFHKFKSMANVVFRDKVGYIGESACQQMDLKNGLYFLGDIDEIGTYAFRTTIVNGKTNFNGTIKTIGNNAFDNARLRNTVVFSKDIETIGDDAFLNAVVGKKNTDGTFTTDVNLEFNGDIKTIGKEAFKGFICYGALNFNGKIDKVGDYAFKDLDVSHLKISEVREFGEGAFMDCQVVNVREYKGLEVLGDKVFLNCRRLQTAILPDSLKKIGSNCFGECVSLQYVRLPANNELEIAKNAFPNQEGLTIEIPEGLSSLDKCNFEGMDKVVFRVSENASIEVMNSIHKNALQYQVGEEGEVLMGSPDKVIESKGDESTENDSEVDEPKDDGSKDDGSKNDSSKNDGSKVDEPKDDGSKDDGSKDDGSKNDSSKNDGAKDNSKAKVAKVGKCYTVSGLKYKVLDKKTVALVKIVDKTMTELTIPAKVKIYKKKFSVKKIANKACYKNKKIKKVVIGNKVSIIGDSAFAKCGNLARIEIGTGLTQIGKMAFYKDKKLQYVGIRSKKLKHIKKAAFRGLSSPKNVTIQASKSKTKFYTEKINEAL